MGLLSNPWWLVGLVVGIAVHEASHALAATYLGDPGPRRDGRLSLNPLHHLDPLGTMALLFVGFGWGKPVMVDPRWFKVGPVVGMAITALAGPVSNILVALLLGLPFRFHAVLPSGVSQGLQYVMLVNLVLAVFNMIPLPPLDGFSVVMGVLPSRVAARILPYARYGPAILLSMFALSFLSGRNFGFFTFNIDPFGWIMGPALDHLLPIVIGR